MVTLSVTRSRVAAVLGSVATSLVAEGWDPKMKPLAEAIDRAADYWPGKGTADAEETTVQAWNALADYLREEPHEWEHHAGRTQAEVVEAVHGACSRLNYLDTEAAGYIVPLTVGAVTR